MKHIYVTVTATPCFTGRFIRTVTNSSYNHVSLSFEPTLKELYSFARRYRSTPFCGGFVKESPRRYRHGGRRAKLLLFRIPVSNDEYKYMLDRIEDFMKNNKDYVYNNLSAVMSLLRLKIKVKNSYTCVEFVSEQLKQLSSLRDRMTKDFYTVNSLKDALSPFLVYEGCFPVYRSDWGDDLFNKRLSVMDIIGEELSDYRKLVTNLVVTLYDEIPCISGIKGCSRREACRRRGKNAPHASEKGDGNA